MFWNIKFIKYIYFVLIRNNLNTYGQRKKLFRVGTPYLGYYRYDLIYHTAVR